MGGGGVNGGLYGLDSAWGIGPEVGAASGTGIFAISGCESFDGVARRKQICLHSNLVGYAESSTLPALEA